MPSDIGVTAAPVYWDYQFIGSYRPTDRDRVRAIVYGSFDDFKLILDNPVDNDPSIRGQLSQYSGFHRAQVAWKHTYDGTGGAVEHEITLTGGRFSFGSTIGPDLKFDVPGWDGFLRAEWRAQVQQRVRLIGGLDVSETWFDGSYRGPALRQLDGDP